MSFKSFPDTAASKGLSRLSSTNGSYRERVA